MKISIWLALPALVLISLTVCSQPGLQSEKSGKYSATYKDGIVINGNSSEWDKTIFSFNKQAQTNYAIVNDSSAIYVCLRIANEATQMKVMKSGIDLIFNTKGKKKPGAVVHYPIGRRTDNGNNMGDDYRLDRKTTRLMFLLQAQDMELSGFREGANGFQNIKSVKNGVMAAVNFDSTGVLVYELRVPFNAFTTDVHNAMPLAVGIIIKGAEKPRQEHSEEMQEPSAGGMQGGQGQGGMHHGGGMGGGEGHMHSYDGNQRSFEDDSIWQFISIANK